MKCSGTACNNEADDFIHKQLGGNYCRKCARKIDSFHLEYVLKNGSLFRLSKTLEQCAQERDSLYVMKHPELWSSRTTSGLKCLHLKNKPFTVNQRYGAMFEGDGPQVYLKSVTSFDIALDPIVYESWEALLQDGWEVD